MGNLAARSTYHLFNADLSRTATSGIGLIIEKQVKDIPLVVLLKFAFEILKLHRVQVAIIPRNTASRRVAEKLNLRNEGIAEKYLEINGEWEDHIRFAITSEEWKERGDSLQADWIC